MDVNRRLGMRDAVLALLLALLRGLPLGEAAPNASPLVASNWGNPRRYVHLQTSTDLNNFYLEIRLDGTVRKAPSRSSYSVILLEAESRERVAILGVKSRRYLCMDMEGRPFASPICLRDDCLFNHKLLENNRDVYYSTRTGILFNLEGSRQVFAAGQNLPQTSLFLPRKNTVPLKRLVGASQRAAAGGGAPDPADPHGVYLGRAEEGSDSRAVAEDDAEPEVEVEAEVEAEAEAEREAGDDVRNVSRETPADPASHDPWNVLSLNAGSPRSGGTMG